MTGSFDGKVALVTGGASGIGRVAAQAFAREGASVLISDIDTEGLRETAQRITSAGGKAVFTRTDVTEASQVKAMLTEVKRIYGRLDFALNNAGIDGDRARTADYSEETWTKVVNVNLTGVF